MTDENDPVARYQRRKEDRKDDERKVQREIKSREGWNRIADLDRKIANANHDEEYVRLEEEVATRAAQMRESKAKLLEEMSKYYWVPEKWSDALKQIILTLPDAVTELDALLSEIHEHKDSLSVLSFSELASSMLQGQNERRKVDLGWIETSTRTLRSQCSSYHRALR